VSVTVIGEAVVDVVQRPEGDAKEVPGGSAANTALALTRLGVKTQFRARLSTDANGDLLVGHFGTQGVDLTEVTRVTEPSSVITALIGLDGAPTYHADLLGASDYGWSLAEISSKLAPDCVAVNFGSLATVIEPGASAISEWVANLPAAITKCYDPNIRPGLMNRDDESVRLQVAYLVSQSDFVKASDVDVAWLYPNLSVSQVAELWANQGPALVVITLGENGAVAARPQMPLLEIPPMRVEVADTIGAGDTFAAAVLNRASRDGSLGAGFREWVKDDQALLRALNEAAVASAITCSRQGANPPTWQEVLAAQ
jgi:fructokinase